jgi:hypothetical protein
LLRAIEKATRDGIDDLVGVVGPIEQHSKQ